MQKHSLAGDSGVWMMKVPSSNQAERQKEAALLVPGTGEVLILMEGKRSFDGQPR